MYDTCTLLYDKTKEKIYPTTFASCVSVTNDEFDNAQDAIDTLKGEISGLLDNVKDLIEDVEYLKEHGGVIVNPIVNVRFIKFPSGLSGSFNYSDFSDKIGDGNCTIQFTHTVPDASTYSIKITTWDGNTISDTGSVYENANDNIYSFTLPAVANRGTNSVSVTVTINGWSGSTSKSFTTFLPCYLIFSNETDCTNLFGETTKIYKETQSVASLSTIVDNLASSSYIWVCVPEGTNLTTFNVGGFAAPYEKLTLEKGSSNTVNKHSYDCYRSLVQYDSGIKLIINLS